LHLEESKIELYTLNPEVFSEDEKNEINSHINDCLLCKEIFDAYRNIYNDISAGLERKKTSNDEEIARRISLQLMNTGEDKLLPENSIVQVYNGKTSIVERPKLFSLANISYFIKNYPIPTFSFAVVVALAMAFIVGQINRSYKDTNPTFCSVANYMLTTYNNSGEILWRKNIYGIPNIQIDSLLEWKYDHKRFLSLLDLDSDGKNEVLVSGQSSLHGKLNQDSLYCFNSDGSLRWIAGVESPKYNYAPNWKRTKWNVKDFFTAKTKNGNKLFVVACDESYGGALVSSLNPKTGQILSTIYHSGWISTEIHFDIDGDGDDEIILGGSSSYDKPFLMVLKSSENLQGVLPDYFNTQKNYIKGNAEYYILFSVSNLGKKVSVSESYNICELKKFRENGIMALTHEAITPDIKYQGLELQYTFNNKLKIQYVASGADFSKAYREFLKKHIFKKPLDSTYWKAMKDSVLYWDGDKFVHYPTQNKYLYHK
jgi:hypothetical protein